MAVDRGRDERHGGNGLGAGEDGAVAPAARTGCGSGGCGGCADEAIEGRAGAGGAAEVAFHGDVRWRAPVLDALTGVLDPQTGADILTLGLVRAVELHDGCATVRLETTPPVCPLIEMVVEDVDEAMRRVLPPGMAIDVAVSQAPGWR